MVFSKLPAFRPTNLKRRLVAVTGLCVLFVALSANAWHGALSFPAKSVGDTADNDTQQIRIKRLKLADPESTETMLAGRSHSLPLRSA